MRTPGVQSRNEPILFGDPAAAEVFAQALAAEGPVERATHGFHTWPAGLHPDAARRLLAHFPGRDVLDPFCGGGTVLVEAAIAGRAAVGRDISPIALLVAAGRATPWSEEALTRARSIARAATEAARKASDPPPPRILEAVERWYHPHVLHELEALRRAVSDAPAEVRPILRLCFSAILVKVSHRASDTSGRREVRDRPAGTAAILFHKKVREYGRRVAALRELVPAGTPAADLAPCDARRLPFRDRFDLVLTSPPYPSTYDYVPLQHLRTVWLGIPDDPGSTEIGARRSWRAGAREAKRRWAEDTARWTEAAARGLRPGGHLVVVIGDGLTPNGTVDTSQATESAARAAGLAPVARASVERIDHARGASRWEHVFAFRRAPV